MSAAVLREAAELMRGRAELARAGKWRVRPSSLTPEASLVTAEWANDSRRVATCSGSIPEGNLANAEHIASWHPVVALAVADWLEVFAECVADDAGMAEKYAAEVESALTVARAYLDGVL